MTPGPSRWGLGSFRGRLCRRAGSPLPLRRRTEDSGSSREVACGSIYPFPTPGEVVLPGCQRYQASGPRPLFIQTSRPPSSPAPPLRPWAESAPWEKKKEESTDYCLEMSSSPTVPICLTCEDLPNLLA